MVPGVASVDADASAHALAVPNDPRFAGQYGPTLIGLPAAWSTAGFGASSVTVAVLDSGIARGHPDFQGARILAGYDYVNRDAVPNDDCGHGTHVAGILGANTNNGAGVAGTSQATILPLKVLGNRCTGSLSTIAQAIVDATDQGADVIAMSLGSSTNSPALSAAVAYAWDHGAILVAAAGNDGSDNSVDYPAAYSQVIAVSAVDANKALASYSSRGPQVEVAAPGNTIDSTTSNGGYGTMSGTSMATPFVAGSIALVLSCAPATTNQQARDALRATAADLGPAGRDDGYGQGLVRADLLVRRLCPDVANLPPSPAFTTTGVGLTRTFDGRASSDPDGDAITWAWAFGDGGTATGSTASHTYAQPGSYLVELQVSDGRLASNATQTLTAEAQSFTATFRPTKSSNEWWVEVQVTSSSRPVAVDADVRGASHALSVTKWGTWAASFQVPSGTAISFTATSAADERVVSPTFVWLAPPPAPDPVFAATFTVPSSVNEWWVAVAVTSSHSVVAVTVAVDGAAPVALTHQSWGDWTRSLPVPQGSSVRFTATDSAGNQTQSQTIAWLVTGPPGPFTATITPTQTTNVWWLEAKVAANQPVQTVQVQVNAGTWADLAKSSWGTWTRSAPVPAGSQVTFRASSNGSTVVGSTYTWG